MISIGIIECIEVHLHLHLIFIGIHITIGGIGQVILISIWDSTIGIDLDSMDMVVHLDIMDSIDMVGMDMVHLGTIGDIDRE